MTSSALAKQIAAAPDKPDPYLVLADELLANGDRHGELIVLQGQKRSAKVVKREAELMKQLAPQLFGDLAKLATRRVKKGERGPLHVEWYMGFARRVRFDCVDEDTHLTDLVPAFLKAPVARFVQHLSFGGVTSEESNHDYGDVIELLAANRPPPTVSSLFFGDFEHEDWEASYNLAGAWDVLSKTFPKLAKLRIHSCGDGLAEPLDLDGLALPQLRELEIVTDHTNSPQLLAQILKLGRLERLAIDFGINTHDEPTLADLAPLLAGKLPLTSLSLTWLDFGPALVAALPASKLAARLEHLGLCSAHLHDASVDVLVANKAKFPKLQSLDLDLNYLTKAAQARAKKLCKQVALGTQWKPSEDYLLD